MKYYVLFGDEDRSDRDIYPYESEMFDDLDKAREWRKMLPVCMECEIVGYDESTNAYEVMEMD